MRARLSVRRALIIFAIASCAVNDATSVNQPSTIELSPARLDLIVGHSGRLVATVRDKSGRALIGQVVVWNSSDVFVATVTATGEVTGVGRGSAMITATVQSANINAVATAVVSLSPIARVTIAAPSEAVPVGTGFKLSLLLQDADGKVASSEGRTIAWRSSDTSRLTVSSDGQVASLATGSVTVSATVDQQVGSVALRTVTRFANVSAGFEKTCATPNVGPTLCWGWNSNGSLGAGTLVSSIPSPTPVAGGHRFMVLSALTNVCGALQDGTGYCWGWNFFPVLGTGSVNGPEFCNGYPCATTPQRIATTLRFSQLSQSASASCGLSLDQQAYCWGVNIYGQLGTGDLDVGNCIPASPPGFKSSCVPVAVAGSLRFRSLTAVGSDGFCGVTTAGDIKCWGRDHLGAMFASGALDTLTRTSPQAVASFAKWSDVVSVLGSTCALAQTGDWYCWGLNRYANLGTGDASATTHTTPLKSQSSQRFSQVTLGGTFACGLDSTKAAWCWGWHVKSYLGTADPIAGCSNWDGGPRVFDCSIVPVPVGGTLRFATISAGHNHLCALTESGALYCWGLNTNGQLGQGLVGDVRSTPQIVSLP